MKMKMEKGLRRCFLRRREPGHGKLRLERGSGHQHADTDNVDGMVPDKLACLVRPGPGLLDAFWW